MMGVAGLVPLPDTAAMTDLHVLAATWCGTGLVEPFRAGLAVATVWLAFCFAPGRPVVVIVAAVAASIAGVWSANMWEAAFGGADDRRIVIDEVAGYLTALALVGRAGWTGAGVAGVFLALDRLKPWPFDRLEAIPGGLGVVADDVILGIAIGLTVRAGMRAYRYRRSQA